ncbi:MAG: Dihydroanticapsin 7-dehydrogenase, partial [Alphaproteobacteria bacterium MarineAlpha2_Bin1]
MSLIKNFNTLFSLEKKNILITGGSSGIGLHAAKLFLNYGANVIITARRKKQLETEVKKVNNKNFNSYVMDVTKKDDINMTLKEIIKKYKYINVLVNNAGITISKDIFEHKYNDWNRVIETNLTGTWITSQLVAKEMSKMDYNISKSIINITSIAPYINLPKVPAYVASKSALSQLTKYLAIELSSYNIRVNSIAPGFFPSKLSNKYFKTERGLHTIKKIPLQRVGELKELDGVL